MGTLLANVAPGRAIKHLTACCPGAKRIMGQAFRRATARSAAPFLDKLLTDMPSPVSAIQVAGGSESKVEFETARETRGIRL